MRRFAVVVVSVLSVAVGACDRAPSAEGLAEWKASDHDRLANQRADQQQQQAQPAPRAPEPPLPPGHPPAAGAADAGRSLATVTSDAGSTDAGTGLSTAELADMAWKNQCSSCHGPTGRGDGPQGPMLHPPDFGSKEWQAQRTDAELAASIANGKNKMPKFGLPERVILALVARVRAAAP